MNTNDFMDKLIINADDFGCDKNINAAIVACFQKNIINSATIMVNMDGFEEAIKLANEHGFQNKIGLHVNLTEGKPLTDLSDTGLTDSNGVFIMDAIRSPRIFFSSHIKRKIKAEIEAQYDKLILHGITPTHIDSHQHVHILPSIIPLFVKLTKEKNQKIRIVTVMKRKNFFIIAYNVLLNIYLKRNGIHFSDKFGNIRYFEKYLREGTDFKPIFEIMVHPAYNDNTLVDYFANTDIEEKTTRIKELYLKKCSATA
jgi:hypothetical protein